MESKEIRKEFKRMLMMLVIIASLFTLWLGYTIADIGKDFVSKKNYDHTVKKISEKKGK